MNLFGKLIPAWIWFAVIAGLAAMVGVQQLRIAGFKTDAAEHKAADAEVARLAEKSARSLETNRQAAVDKEVKNAQPAIETERRDAAALPDSRVREPAIRYIRSACANPPAAPASAPAADALLVFADVLGRIEQRQDDLAELAGKRGAAGALCERSYDGVEQATDRQVP